MSAKMQPWLWLVFSVKLAGKTQSGLAQACTRAENVDGADSATGGTDRSQAVGTGQAGGGKKIPPRSSFSKSRGQKPPLPHSLNWKGREERKKK